MTQEFGDYHHFDLEFIRDIADQDDEMMSEIVRSFLLNNPKNIVELEKAVQDNNRTGVNFAVHKLYGAFSLLGAYKASALVKHIETIEDLTTVSDSIRELKEISVLLDEELKDLLTRTGK